MLRYTGHPVADVGVATVCALCEKTDPATITTEDLVRVAEFLEHEYFSGKLLSYLTCVFPNSMYVQPAAQAGAKLKAKPATMSRFKAKVLYGFREPPDPAVKGLRCAFSGEPPAQLVYRQHVPMITGESVLNFFPAGAGGMPISADFLLAIQAFPLGSRRCLGRALAVHCPDDQTLTYEFAHRFLNDNRQLLLLAQRTGKKYEDAKAPRTLVIDVLVDIARRRMSDSCLGQPLPWVTVYHLTNSGQGPDIAIFELPSEVVAFVVAASRAGTADTWNRIVARAWENTQRTSETKKSKREDDKQPEQMEPKAGTNRNFLYEDLFGLPRNAARFVRTYFLRRAWRFARQSKNDPRSEYAFPQELDLVSWPLTHLFLREILGMERNRIEAIRALADRLAEHIRTSNDLRLFQRLYMVKRYNGLRLRLLQASRERLTSGKDPLIGFDDFVLIFEETEDTPRLDWRLARDLVLIRLIEQLRDFFTKEPAALEGVTEPEDPEETENEPESPASS